MLNQEEHGGAVSIYEKLQAIGVPIDSHESDLYVKVTPETSAMVDGYEFRCNVTTFRSEVDGERWYDIPFAFDPFWAMVSGS